MRTATLDDIVRQKDPALKSAVELLATGQVSAALDVLQQQGRVKEIPNHEERVRAIAKGYIESPQNTLIVSPDNASRRELNLAVRQELKATGAVAPEDRNFRVLIQRQDMTGAERSWASHYEIDDVVRYTRGSKAIGIEAAAMHRSSRSTHPQISSPSKNRTESLRPMIPAALQASASTGRWNASCR